MRDDELRELANLEETLRGPLDEAAARFDEAELRAIRGRATEIAVGGEASGSGDRRWWARRYIARFVSLAAVAALAIAALGWGLLQSRTNAFAVDQAADVLIPRTEVLHVIETMTTTSSPSPGQQQFAPVTDEFWIAPGGTKARKIERLASTGQLMSTYLTQGPGSHRRFGAYEGASAVAFLGQGRGQVPAASAFTSQNPPPLQSVSDRPVNANPGFDDPRRDVSVWRSLRADLESGKAKVLGIETISGQRYWHVRSADTAFVVRSFDATTGLWVIDRKPPKGPWVPAKMTIDALLHEGDYRPKQATITSVSRPFRGIEQPFAYTTNSTRLDVLTWESIPPQNVPRGTFDMSSIPVTGPNVTLEYRADEMGRFHEFGVWRLTGPSNMTTDSSPTVASLLEGGTIIYETPQGGSALGGQPGPTLHEPPPAGWTKLSDRSVHAEYAILDKRGKRGNQLAVVFVASMPKASEASETAFLGREGKLGKPVSGIVNGLTYRGVESFTPNAVGNFGGMALIDTERETLVVAYSCGNIPLSTKPPRAHPRRAQESEPVSPKPLPQRASP